MFKVYIRSRKETQQHRGYNEYRQEEPHGHEETHEYDEYDEQQGEEVPSECCICGGSISSSHLVLAIKGIEYQVHTSCLITGMALITNGIAILVGLFKPKSTGNRQEEGSRE